MDFFSCRASAPSEVSCQTSIKGRITNGKKKMMTFIAENEPWQLNNQKNKHCQTPSMICVLVGNKRQLMKWFVNNPGNRFIPAVIDEDSLDAAGLSLPSAFRPNLCKSKASQEWIGRGLLKCRRQTLLWELVYSALGCGERTFRLCQLAQQL